MDMPRYPFTNLVFEGGGVKGVAYVGALQVLEDRGIAGRVDAVAGTSAGAITAALVAAGYSAAELKTTMMALDLRSSRMAASKVPPASSSTTAGTRATPSSPGCGLGSPTS